VSRNPILPAEELIVLFYRHSYGCQTSDTRRRETARKGAVLWEVTDPQLTW